MMLCACCAGIPLDRILFKQVGTVAKGPVVCKRADLVRGKDVERVVPAADQYPASILGFVLCTMEFCTGSQAAARKAKDARL